MPDGKMKKTAQGKEEIHMTELLKLPVGIENFEEIRRDNPELFTEQYLNW